MTPRPLLLAIAIPLALAAPLARAGDAWFGESAPFATTLPGGWMDGAPGLAAATTREGRAFGYTLDVPAGPYRLELGFSELSVARPSRRTFAVLVNGAPVIESLDVFAEAGRAPSFVRRSFDVEAGDAGLRVELFARTHRAALSWIRLEGDGASRFVDCGGGDDLPGPGADAPLGEVILAKLGARAFLDLRPQWRSVETSPLGKGFEEERPTLIGLVVDGEKVALPFNQPGADTVEFDEVRQERTLTSVTYHVRTGGITGAVTLTAPFHPGDLELSELPVFHLRFRVDAIEGPPPEELRAAVFLPVYEGTGRRITPAAPDYRGIVMERTYEPWRTARGIFLGRPGGDGAGARDSHLRVGKYGAWVSTPIDTSDGLPAEVDLLYVLYVGDPVLSVEGVPHRLGYTTRSSSIDEVAERAAARLDRALEASRVVDSLVADAVLPAGLKALMLDAFSSVLLNTYRTVAPDGTVSTTYLDGARRTHAPVAAEASVAPFFEWFAPHLLDDRLDAWPRAVRDGVLVADLGWETHVGTGLGDRGATHDHPVEASADALLTAYVRWVHTGDDDVVRSRASFLRGRLDALLAADGDGDGVPDRGTASPLHDASPALQYARERTAAATRAAAALLAGAEMVRLLGDGEAAARAEAAAATLAATLDREAWRGDHYGATLDGDDVPLVDPRPRLPAVDLRGDPAALLAAAREGASPHASVGLLPVLRAGLALPFDEERLRSDLRVGSARSMRTYGSAYSEREVRGRVSLDLLRDAVQCRLGEDVLDRCDRYAALQAMRAHARDLRDWGGFCDSAHDPALAYSPRGGAVFALVDAAAGLVVDRRRGTVRLRPVRAPLRVPLASFADWPALRVPWLEVTRGADGTPAAAVTEPDLLAPLEVTVDLSLVGGGVEVLGGR